MAGRRNLSVSLTAHHAEFLANCVASGRYQSASEAVREALRLLEDAQARRRAGIERARTLIEEGADDLDAGRIVDADTFFSDWDDEIATLEAESRRRAQ